MTRPTQVTLEGKGPVTLRPGDHIATGGEGSIYRVGDLAVKMYLDPERQRNAGLPEKIKLLSKLQHPYVVAPRGLVLNSTAEPVGHYLPFVDKGHALSMVFTNEFWTKEGFDIRHAMQLVDGMRATVEFIHQHQALLVDANELNWFAMLNGGAEPRVIDVDSFAIGRWPASVIMPSIRDWNSKTFDDGTDWFAWACVTFQIYAGIHPYKGSLSGFDRGDLVGRMKARASVFMPGVKLNRAVRDFSTIPGALRKWYEAVFQSGERSAPPSPYDASVSAAPAAKTARAVTVGGGGLLVYERVYSVPKEPAIRVFHCGAVLSASGLLTDSATKSSIARTTKGCEVVRVEHGWLIGDQISFRYIGEGDGLDLGSGLNSMLSLQVESHQLLSYENRLFAVTDRGLVEIQVKLFGQKPIASVGNTWGIMVNSTKWFSGFGVLDAMGAMFLILPFGKESVAQLRTPELDGLRVVAGKAGNRFCSIVAVDKNGDYVKLEFTFDKDYALAPKVWRGPADSAELNLAILPKGVCATILKDGELDIFSLTGNVRRVEDSQISTDMALANWGDTVVYIQNGDVWSVKLK